MFAGIPLFEGMTEEELERSAGVFEQRKVMAGEALTREDEFGYTFFVVLSGRLKVDVGGETVDEIGAGDHFGEVALVRGEKRNATIRALETCQLARCMAWDFTKLTETNPSLAKRIQAAVDARDHSADAE